jgi:hypothetical protein
MLLDNCQLALTSLGNMMRPIRLSMKTKL